MYESYYGFNKKPFSINPDPDFLYLNAAYQEAIALLQYGVQEGKGIVSLIGEVGTGKTMLLNQLLGSHVAGLQPVMIPTLRFSYDELVDFLLLKLKAPVAAVDPKSRVDALFDILYASLRDNNTIVLLVDEAQDLDNETLENIRLLSNFETPTRKLLQIILVGQPELRNKLNLPELRQLKQRIAVSYMLQPLAPDETSSYIAHRLKNAGYRHGSALFSPDAVALITAYSKGIPRLINALCDNALLIGFADDKHLIDVPVIEEAANDLMLEKPAAAVTVPGAPARVAGAPPVAADSARPSRPLWRWAAATALLLIAVGGGYSAWRFGDGAGLKPPSDFVDNLLKQLKAAVGAAQTADPETSNPQAAVASPQTDHPKNAKAVDHPEDAVAPPAAAFAGAANAPRSPAHGGAADADASAVAKPVFSSFRAIAPEPEQVQASAPIKQAAATQATTPVQDGGDIVQEETQARPAHQDSGVARTETIIKTMQEGDTLSNIAKEIYGHFGLYELTAIKIANPEISDLDRVATGQNIVMPELLSGMMIFHQQDGSVRALLGVTQSLATAKRWQDKFAQQGVRVSVKPERLSKTIDVYRLEAGGAMNNSLDKLIPLRLMVAEYGELDR